MAQQLDGPGHGLNVLSREALADASLLDAEVILAAANENKLLRRALRQVGLG
jgi:translation initiation factor 2 gamma subunit (eIF-2gamma)